MIHKLEVTFYSFLYFKRLIAKVPPQNLKPARKSEEEKVRIPNMSEEPCV